MHNHQWTGVDQKPDEAVIFYAGQGVYLKALAWGDGSEPEGSEKHHEYAGSGMYAQGAQEDVYNEPNNECPHHTLYIAGFIG